MALFTSLGIASALGVSAGLFTSVSAFALNTAVGIGLSYLTNKLFGQTQDQNAVGGVEGNLQAGGTLARALAIGWAATAGSLVYANTWGEDGKTPNAYITQVIALADWPIAANYPRLWVNGQLCTYGSTPDGTYGYPVVEYTQDGRAYMWVKFYDGTQTSADLLCSTIVSSDSRPYASTRVGKGIPYVVVTCLVNEELYSGFPQFKFDFNGAKLYDISKDSTMGGSGSHRYSDPTTWGGDGDFLPAVQIYNILRGMYYNGKWFYGLQGSTAATLPASNWIAAINKCRVQVEGPDGYESQYRSGGVIEISNNINQTVQALLSTCQGRISSIGGFYKLYLGEPDLPVMAFDDGDIISTDSQMFTPFFKLDESITGVVATYPEPLQGWNAKTAPIYYRTDLEASTGGRRIISPISINLCPYSSQVQRLIKQAVQEAQRARKHTFNLPPKYRVLEPGDIVSYSSSRNGYETKLFRVDGVAHTSGMDVIVDITEVDPDDYDYDFGSEYVTPTIPTAGPIYPATQLMTGWQVFPATIDNGEQQLPSQRVQFDGDLDDVQFVRIQSRLALTDAVVFDGTVPYGSPSEADEYGTKSVILNGSFLPHADYETRGKFLPYSNRPTEWSDWLSVTTPDSWVSATNVKLKAFEAEVRAYFKRVYAELKQVNEDAVAQLTDVATRMLEDSNANAETVRGVKNNYAAIIRETVLRESADEVFASDISGVQAALSGYTGANAVATAFSEQLASINANTEGININASNILGVQSQLGNSGSSAIFKMQTGYTPSSGWSSKIQMMVATSIGGDFKPSGVFLEANASGGRILLDANQVAIINSGTVAALFEAGTTYIANARIVNLDADNISIGGVQLTSLGLNSVSQKTYTAGSASSATGTWTSLGTCSIANDSGVYPIVKFLVSLSANGGGSTTSVYGRIRNTTTGTVLKEFSYSTTGSGTLNDHETTIDHSAVVGSNTYSIEYQLVITGAGSGSASLYAYVTWGRR